ncbi:hypothetical protein [Halalkalicoccus subterraneus]|uniref:hypothetical protein n=1 Tax=Halalkalicoccus subterraneus TaxID=2675002 RepID=UPI000EFC19E2|nr:hypothetical protein [Halalkalicoccus subterraneus]
MSSDVWLVTRNRALAARYRVALSPLVCRRETKWPRPGSEASVVLFDPATVSPPGEGATRYQRAIELGDGVEATVRRVERAIVGQRFEAAIDARFEALSAGSANRPPIEVPDGLGVSALGDLYEVI